MSQIISHFALIICAGLATRRKYQCSETMKLRTACVNILDVLRYFLQFPIIRLLLTLCLSSIDGSHFELKQPKLWWSKGALGFLNDEKGILIFKKFFRCTSLSPERAIFCVLAFSMYHGFTQKTQCSRWLGTLNCMIWGLLKASLDQNTKSQTTEGVIVLEKNQEGYNL